MYLYICNIHGWNQMNKECPSCNPVVTTAHAGSVSYDAYTSIKVSELEKLKTIIKDYEEALEAIVEGDYANAWNFKEHSIAVNKIAREVLKKHKGE